MTTLQQIARGTLRVLRDPETNRMAAERDRLRAEREEREYADRYATEAEHEDTREMWAAL